MKERLWKPGNAFSGGTGVRLSEEYGAEGDTGGNSAMPVFQCQCALSAKGKVVEKIEAGPQGRDMFSYEYDAAGHLTLVRKNELLWEYYQYDEDGRRIQDFRAWAGGKRLLTYYYTGELIQAGDTELEWTDKGQLAALKQQGRRTAFAYGQDTRLDRAVLADGQDVRYFYGQELMPIKVTRNGSLAAEYLWLDRLRLIRHKDALNGLVHEFVYGNRRSPVQCIVSGTQEAMHNATGHYERSLTLSVWTDQVDSVRVLSLPDGRPVKCIEYDAFGNVTADTRPEWEFPLGFACGLNDHFTGLVRFGFRDYDPRFGRFTAKDPIGDTGGDHDLWDYCVDDPVSTNDPTGLIPPLIAGFVGGVGALTLGGGGAYGAAKLIDKLGNNAKASDAVIEVMPKVARAHSFAHSAATGGPLMGVITDTIRQGIRDAIKNPGRHYMNSDGVHEGYD